jgi:glycosyltransferase involved in cell wall biosynthesis
MKVLFESSPLLGASAGRGIGTYTHELLQALRALDTGKETLLIQATHELGYVPENAHEQFDLIHYPYFDLFFHTLPIESRIPTVVTVHDVIPLLYPRQYPPGIKGKIRFWKQKRALQASSRLDIETYMDIPADRIRSIYLAGSSNIHQVSEKIREETRQLLHLPSKYIVYVGDINYNKNLPMLLVVLTQLPKSVHLCVVSRAFTNTDIPEGQALAKVIQENEIEDRVHVLDIPKDRPEMLSAVLQESVCLVQPSLYEGFGLPVLEAMQAGTVVVSTDGGSLPEVAGTAAILCEPKINSLTEAIREALSLDAAERKERISAGKKNLKRFCWERTAQQTYQAYKEAYEIWQEQQKGEV